MGTKSPDLLWFIRDVGEDRNIGKVSSAQVLSMLYNLEPTTLPNIIHWASENVTRANSSASAVPKLASVCQTARCSVFVKKAHEETGALIQLVGIKDLDTFRGSVAMKLGGLCANHIKLIGTHKFGKIQSLSIQ